MKTNRILLQLFVLSILLFSFMNTLANKPLDNTTESETISTKLYQSSGSDAKLKLVNIQFDPLGFIFFGPQLAVDFQFADMIAIGPYARWNYAGVLYQGFITDWFTSDYIPQAGSYGIGVGVKFIPPIGSGKHRPYVDIGYEKFSGGESYDPQGSYGEHIYKYKANVFHFGAGYRMVSESSFNLSIGFFIGISKETENYDYYEFESTKDYNSLADPQVFPGIQLLLGWQFGG